MTFKLDFPGHLCGAAFAILAMLIYVNSINVVVAQMFFYVTSSPARLLLCIFGEKAEKAGTGGHTQIGESDKRFCTKIGLAARTQYYTVIH